MQFKVILLATFAALALAAPNPEPASPLLERQCIAACSVSGIPSGELRTFNLAWAVVDMGCVI